MSRKEGDRSYVRAVETAWSQALGRAIVVSPREFEAVESWRQRGIPLSIVLEVIGSAAKRRSGHLPRSLTGLAKPILDAWAVIAAGRASPHPTAELPVRSDARRAWREALLRCGEGDRLHALLSSLLDREAKGHPAASLDAELDAELPASAPEVLVQRVTDETRRDLERFRGRMRDEEFERMFARARVDRLRAELRVPRLELSR